MNKIPASSRGENLANLQNGSKSEVLPVDKVDNPLASTGTLHLPQTFTGGLMIAALGVVFGDIGTSPLYAMKAVFTTNNGMISVSEHSVYGILSVITWSVMIVVSLKYLSFVMRADNEGEGGILALTALIRHHSSGRLSKAVTIIGIMGAALFFGDSMITPAMSVMSAVEGLDLVYPQARSIVVPISIVILLALFSIQRFGTGKVGRLFGPVMLAWFVLLAILGIPYIVQYPSVLQALLPTYALSFAIDNPFFAFAALGACVLVITGAEALYADMGHFGRKPISMAWALVVLPALVLNYFGQGALLLHDQAALESPFFYLVPDVLRIPVVIIATLATVIASQAVISGAYSVTAQALNLGFLPRMRVLHTSKEASGQIYIPAMNLTLLVGVMVLILLFQSSDNLAHAYGLAVTATEILTTTLFLICARVLWKWPLYKIVPLGIVVVGLELLYFSATLPKIPTGGWLPIMIATVFIAIMADWVWGQRRVRQIRQELGISMSALVAKLRTEDIRRVHGQAIYLHQNRGMVPLSLKENIRFNQSVHEQVLLLRVNVLNVPHVRHAERISVKRIGAEQDGVFDVTIDIGFNDNPNIPHNLRLCSKDADLGFVFDEKHARYFVSLLGYRRADPSSLWHKIITKLFVILSRNASSRVETFGLPRHHTVVIGGVIHL
ncbi:potassium transporter Kup [Arcanobacterium hippocoleae]|uniref:Probable potassium transport system protein Kup n=1 Tax=Arcanobacterium hippocoleae TaxID=149017 RepID=A0ABU1T2L3_9ACTO|nr:KUP/HAK/KT family potassium transporter [Arcanobacterium hippocoleae]MDR6939121.1 KUP system potassium uptake protein [Arcanobacterium hippocoleae]